MKRIIIYILLACILSNIVFSDELMTETYKEEIVNRINDHTDDQLNNYIDAKLETKFNQKKEVIISDIDQRINSLKFFFKMVVVGIFGAVFLSLCGFLYLKMLINRGKNAN